MLANKIIENVFKSFNGEVLNDFRVTFDNIKDKKDLSHVHWGLLAYELKETRNLGVVTPEIQSVIDPVIQGMEMLASGKEWSKESANDALSAVRAIYTLGSVSDEAIYILHATAVAVKAYVSTWDADAYASGYTATTYPNSYIVHVKLSDYVTEITCAITDTLSYTARAAGDAADYIVRSEFIKNYPHTIPPSSYYSYSSIIVQDHADAYAHRANQVARRAFRDACNDIRDRQASEFLRLIIEAPDVESGPDCSPL